MRALARPLSLVYKYLTAFVVIASPLFFIPGTAFTPEATYYLVIISAVTIALIAYVLNAVLTRFWHQVTRFEVISYALFSIALILSALLARDPKSILFGNEVNSFSALSLLTLPAVIYLVRSLPDEFRKKIKKILVGIIFVATFLFLFTFMFQGQMSTTFAQAFSGFTSPLSLVMFIGIFVILVIGYIRKINIPLKYKLPIAITTLVVIGLLLSLSSRGDIRPNFTGSILVAKKTLISQGVFGIGAGDFTRAWQLYRPQAVIDSPYFDIEFTQGSGTFTTFFTTIGVFGGTIFVLFMLGALYLTYLTYRKEESPEDKHIALVLGLIQLYFFISAWVAPLSFAVLILWMVIVGFGLAKARLNEQHPSKVMLFIATPLAILLAINLVTTINKTRAILVFSKAQIGTNQKTEDIDSKIDAAIAIKPIDVFYRSKLENAINATRALVTTEQSDQEALKQKYISLAQKAIDAGLSAVQLNPFNYQNYVSLGRAYELTLPFDKEGAYDRAKKSYQEAINLYPDNPYLYVMMARLEAVSGSKEVVRLALTDALKKKQNFADALYLMSQLEASEQKIDEAIAYAIKATENAPKDPATFLQAGLLFYGKKDYQNAVNGLQRALELDPNNSNIAYFLALSLRDGGRSDIAKQIADELMRRNPGNADLTAFLNSLSTTTPTTSTTTPKAPAKTGAKVK